MRRTVLTAAIAPLGLAVILATAAQSPALAQTVTVAIGGELQDKVQELGEREVRDQADRLGEVVTRVLAREGSLEGARVELVLTDLKPNRPTFQQLGDTPGLDGIRSISIGGAAIEGEILLADGTRQPVRYDWYSSSLEEVRGFGTWQDADRAFSRFANNLVAGRYVSR
ncbi:hypothetical protein JIP62_03330 [Brevundimonas vitis]|uniref:Uncharacterized protein n=1 Tax=Brevundimonas vitisensis TaxID=2800818 RepID=A0ABX7BNN7_9CAUL|nr:hypothetical protein [Brevundimonas vitisensis]QQQ19166.1 hypothetical protein JIP62_03330 [Brevundimonas vitisensis]